MRVSTAAFPGAHHLNPFNSIISNSIVAQLHTDCPKSFLTLSPLDFETSVNSVNINCTQFRVYSMHCCKKVPIYYYGRKI